MPLKKTKRLTGIVLSLVMLFAAAMPGGAFAAGYAGDIDPLGEMAGAIGYITGQTLTPQQTEALSYLRGAGRQGGLLGFDGEYEIDGSSPEMTGVIVEFVNQPARLAVMEAAAKAQKLSLSAAESMARKDRTDFQTALNRMFPASRSAGSLSYEITAAYETAFNGVAITLPANKVEALAAMDCVFAVYPDVVVRIDPDDGEVVSDTPAGMAAERDYLGVDGLHARGITGKGIQVGVIDTGIDYNHPDLKGAYAGGRNFVVSSVIPSSGQHDKTVMNKRPADDPMETTYDEWAALADHVKFPEDGRNYNLGTFYTGHGTHVCGIIAGRGVNSPNYALGMAPEATLFVYRVLGPYGVGEGSWVLSAIDKVAEDGCDVVNLSLGIAINDPSYPVSVAVNNIILQYDIVFAVTAGNKGQNSATGATIPASLGSPGTSSLAVTVANAYTPLRNGAVLSGGYRLNRFYDAEGAQYSANGDGTYSLTYAPLAANGDGKYKLVPTAVDAQGMPSGTGAASEYTPAVKAAVAGNIAVIRRGNSFLDSMKNAIDAGAGGLLLINLEDSSDTVIVENRGVANGEPCLPFFGMTYADGAALWNAVKDDPFISFDGFDFSYTGLAASSSRGPLGTTYDIKPDVAAPGTQILSCAPYFFDPEARSRPAGTRYADAYAYYSGTSMAAPHVAGIAALLMGYGRQNGLNWSAYDIKARIVNNADPYGFVNYSVFEIGGGYINPSRALDAETVITVGYDSVFTQYYSAAFMASGKVASLSFGVAGIGQAYSRTLTATLTNSSGSPKTFEITNAFTAAGLNVKNPAAAGVSFAAGAVSVTVPAGGTADVTFTMSVPASTSGADAGVYGGFVTFKNGAEAYTVPYGLSIITSSLPAPYVTGFSIGHKTYVAGLPAGMRFNVAGVSLKSAASLSVVLSKDGIDLTAPVAVAEGSTLVQYPAMPDVPGKYTAKLLMGGAVVRTDTFTIEALPADIWSPKAVDSGDGAFDVLFAAPVVIRPGSAATLNGSPVAVSYDGGVVSVAAGYSSGAKLVLSGVSFPTLFPGYSFTFTVRLA